MIYKGTFYFDKKNHPGECEIDDNNNIYLTINESSINGYKKKITGFAGNEYISLYNCFLIGNGIGYYKYRVGHVVKKGICIKYKNVDFSKHIQSFRFTFNRLDEWLNIKTIIKEKNEIKFNIPNDILLYNNDKLKIYVKYFEENCNLTDTSIKNFNIIPYICVSSDYIMSIEKIMIYVQMITRFFALFMGYSSQVRLIKFHKMYKGKNFMGDIEDEVVINTDFSNWYCNHLGYPTFNLRTYYNCISDSIIKIFSKWHDIYFNKSFKEAINVYYSPYKSHTIEDDFLTIMKCIEKFSYATENIEEKEKKNKAFKNILQRFYEENKISLEKAMKDNDFKKEYIQNIDNIHESVANAIVYQYDRRVKLASRIKKIDKNNIMPKRFEYKQCKKEDSKSNVYDYLANTRNYYTHLNTKDYILKEEYLPGYVRRLEKIFISNLLFLVIDDEKYVEDVLNKDEYLSIYDNRDI